MVKSSFVLKYKSEHLAVTAVTSVEFENNYKTFEKCLPKAFFFSFEIALFALHVYIFKIS